MLPLGLVETLITKGEYWINHMNPHKQDKTKYNKIVLIRHDISMA